ncbi:uncharacterized protein LOC108991075 [Juglans regia]|uniref:Uncharacterized protein LOC108991075 n=1 Tax=Juglans regia TaxID=51240 RepID=A0A2I4EN22_JUGRE|nr:uncharacterized protein LOC108991075 [Juglans regia]
MRSYWKWVVSGLRERSFKYATSTSLKLKACYSPTADYAQLHYHQPHHGHRKLPVMGHFMPVHVAVGMIVLSTGLGIHAAMQHLLRAPDVRVSKKRREMIPEVVEPDHVIEEAVKFIRKSFFRKVAHVQEFNNPEKQVIPDPIHKDAYAYRPRAETLKSVGIDPRQI